MSSVSCVCVEAPQRAGSGSRRGRTERLVRLCLAQEVETSVEVAEDGSVARRNFHGIDEGSKAKRGRKPDGEEAKESEVNQDFDGGLNVREIPELST